jgi:hypothetical protein
MDGRIECHGQDLAITSPANATKMAAILPSLKVFLLFVWQGEGWQCQWGKELNIAQGHKRLFLGTIPV